MKDELENFRKEKAKTHAEYLIKFKQLTDIDEYKISLENFMNDNTLNVKKESKIYFKFLYEELKHNQ